MAISPRFSFKGAFKSVIRHTVIPTIGGAVMAAIQTTQSGSLDPAAMKAAALGVVGTAGASGVARLTQWFLTTQQINE